MIVVGTHILEYLYLPGDYTTLAGCHTRGLVTRQ